MATELTDLDLGEWSICIDPANEDSTIEIVKSKSGLAPILKETDMSDTYEVNENDADEAVEAFASEVIEDFNALSEDEQAEALVGMALRNEELEEAVEDAAEVVKSLTENAVSKAKYDEVVKLAKSAGDLIEKMKQTGNAATDDGGLVNEIRKANGGADLSPEAVARIEAIEKAQAVNDRKEAINKARAYGFDKAEDVADIEATLRKSNAALADAYVSQVKKAAALQKSSKIFTQIGEDAGADAGDPIAKAKGVIAEVKKANPTFTEQQAFAKAIEQNPGLYRELEAARVAA